MKILITAASFASSISGVQRHALNLVRCLLLRGEIAEIHLVVAPWQCEIFATDALSVDHRLKTHITAIDRGSLSRNLWHYRELPLLARQLHVDLVHLSFPMPINAQAFDCPTAVTLHDLYPYEIPENFGFPKFLFNRAVLRQCLGAADGIACVSEATRLRLKQYVPATTWRKAVRIYNCVESESPSAADPPFPFRKSELFLLCIAQHRRNKNIQTLIRAFHRLLRSEWIEAHAKLAVIGMRGPETARIRRLVSEYGLDGNVFFLEGLSEDYLQWCYRNCAMVVAPSITEGFGFSVAEALLAGCRIVCSDIPAHREVGGSGCRFVNLGEHAEQSLAAAIADALSEPKPAPIALPQFSASVLAAQYLAFYRQLNRFGKLAQTDSAHLSRDCAFDEDASIVPERSSALAYRGD
jgi:glycosyltransferase involved in cell wall biosynthesis